MNCEVLIAGRSIYRGETRTQECQFKASKGKDTQVGSTNKNTDRKGKTLYIYIHTDHHTELDEQRPPEREEEEEKDEKGGRCTDHFVGSCITRLKGLCLRGG